MPGLEGLLTGRTLVKRYLIEEVIGRGGFAAVYRAQDERLGRPVAVKVITYPAPDEETREQLRQRFQREARALAALPQHPNLVTVHDFGVDPELGLDFLVMELLHGDNLATYLERNGPPPLPVALQILRDAAEGLSLGHRAGLVHRDVKPGNLFLATPPEGDSLRVSVLDFGIAQALADEAESRLTRTGMMPHSPAYASPEQMRGEVDLTPASDVFSLGVVGYQLLTGERPFAPGPRTTAADWTPARPIRALNPAAPPAVEEVILRAMAYDPAARFPDAGAMADALDRAAGQAAAAPPATGEVIAAAAPVPAVDDDHTLLQPEPPPPPAPEREAVLRPEPRERRRRPAYGKWALGAVLLAAATLAGLWALGRGGPPPPEAITVSEPLDSGIDAATPADGSTPRVTVVPGPDTGAMLVDTVALPPIDTTFASTLPPATGLPDTAARAPTPLPAEALPLPVVPPVPLDSAARADSAAGRVPRPSAPAPDTTPAQRGVRDSVIIPNPHPRLLGVPVERDTTGGE